MKHLKLLFTATLIVFLSLVGTSLTVPHHALADSDCDNINFQDGIDNSSFNCFNPLNQSDAHVDDPFSGRAGLSDLSTPRGILSRVLAFSFPLAGLILFVMITWGGFQIVVNSGSKKSIDTGRERVTAAIVGFIILFSSYWIIQIVETIFGLQIL